MPKKRKPRLLKTTIKVLIICEGETEKDLVDGLLKYNKFSRCDLTCVSLSGGGYAKFREIFAKNKDLYRFTLYITDLDRATNLPSELRNLKSNIASLLKDDKLNNIFLSYPEVETFISAAINVSFGSSPTKESIKNTLLAMGYSKGKGSYRFYRDNKGSIENAKRNLNQEYFFLKTNGESESFSVNTKGLL